MKNKTYIPLLILPLICICACTGQGVLPPLPEDVLEFDASMQVIDIDQTSGDVTVEYTLIIRNVGDITLERVILKDFITPTDVVMQKDTFRINNLGPNEERAVVFNVTVLGWYSEDAEEQTWDVDYSIRIEEGDAYTEQDVFYYQLNLYLK
jgi:uncharacterized repeat protein (TIGR01451 family)